MNQENKELLLKIARKSIKNEEITKNIPDSLQENRGVFVTLTINNQLRGCIGYIQPIASIFDSVVECAKSAAYRDPRFPPVSKDEIDKLKIEISVLTQPNKLEYKDKNDLLNKLTNKDGVVLKKSFHSSTFLPQVWEDMPNKEEFLSHLCTKAGLLPDEWTSGQLDIEIYHVEKFTE